jgi:hypothetical protein
MSTQIVNRQIADQAIDDAKVKAAAGIATSKLADGANFVKKDGSVPMTGSLDSGNNKIVNVSTPTSSSDAANKSYVDTQISNLTGIYQPKGEARLATTIALAANTYNNGTAGVGATLTGNSNGSIGNIDGITPSANDIILVKNEATQANNGLYTVTQVGDGSHPYILTRATSMNTATSIPMALIVIGSEGSTLANTIWICSTAEGMTVGTTAVTFVQSSSATINFADEEVPSGSINGSNVTFTLAHAPNPAGSLKLYLNGQRIKAGGTDYSLSGSTITMVTAPGTGESGLIADYRY